MSSNQIYEKLRHGEITAIIDRASEIRGTKIYRDAWYRWIEPTRRGKMYLEISEAISQAWEEFLAQKAEPAAA